MISGFRVLGFQGHRAGRRFRISENMRAGCEAAVRHGVLRIETREMSLREGLRLALILEPKIKD
jgi:hypothetical protein